MDQNLKLKSIESSLHAERDEILVELDDFLNNQSSYTSPAVIIKKLKELSIINQTLLAFESIIQDNKNLKSKEALEMLSKLEELNAKQSKQK